LAPNRRSSSLNDSIRAVGRKIDAFKRDALKRRLALMERYRIDLVLDVGANTGQYAKGLRKAGYGGRIVSFEPLSTAFARLARSAARDPAWEAVHLGLGGRNHETTLHVSGDSQASSLREMLPLHREVASYFSYVGEERVSIRKLDTIWDEHVSARSRVYLKLDTQGFEKEVLDGAARSFPRVQAVQLEMSIEPLYEGTPLLPDMIRLMNRKGFTLMSVEYGVCHPETGQMLQLDGIFARKDVRPTRARGRSR
jgi:FkbM family methyltransferase